MTEVLIERPETQGFVDTEIFLIDGNVHPDITGFFLMADKETQEKLAGVVGIMSKVTREFEVARPESRTKKSRDPVVSCRSFVEIVNSYPDFFENLAIVHFVDALTLHTADELILIEQEFMGILNGNTKLSTVQRQQLSNLSSNDLTNYILDLGLDNSDLESSVLDLGAGREAEFAHGMGIYYPEVEVTSTSMHMLNPESQMSKRLADRQDVGRLVACSVMDMPFEPGSFRTIVSLNAVPFYLPEKELLPAMRNIYRVLMIGGRAILGPALVNFGDKTITDDDLKPLKDEMNISLTPTRPFYGMPRDNIIINKQ